MTSDDGSSKKAPGPKSPDRRRFLRGSVIGAAGAVAAQATPALAQEPAASAAKGPTPGPSPWLAAAESRTPGGADEGLAQHVEYPGSDFMIDCMKAAGIEVVALCPGSSFRGLQESAGRRGPGRCRAGQQGLRPAQRRRRAVRAEREAALRQSW